MRVEDAHPRIGRNGSSAADTFNVDKGSFVEVRRAGDEESLVSAWSLQFDALRQRWWRCQWKRTVWYSDEVDVEVTRTIPWRGYALVPDESPPFLV